MALLSRRQFFRRTAAVGGLLAGGVIILNGCADEDGAATNPTGGTTSGGEATVDGMAEDRFAEQVEGGLEYFRGRADDQLPLAEALLAAIEAGNLEEARAAYIEARPPYEEIEVLALNFEETDSDIDARPYAFDEGESSEDYRGFHRIEGLLFRDEDVEGAVPYAERLVESVMDLQEDLTARGNFSAATHFEGMIGLAGEAPSKKISSEEETYSDQSLLIFRHNLIGVFSQFEPFEAEVSEAYEGPPPRCPRRTRRRGPSSRITSPMGGRRRRRTVRSAWGFGGHRPLHVPFPGFARPGRGGSRACLTCT